jgi:hypothetical protein
MADKDKRNDDRISDKDRRDAEKSLERDGAKDWPRDERKR